MGPAGKDPLEHMSEALALPSPMLLLPVGTAWSLGMAENRETWALLYALGESNPGHLSFLLCKMERIFAEPSQSCCVGWV